MWEKQWERSGPAGTELVQEELHVQSSSSLQPNRGPWWSRLSPAARGHSTEQISPCSHGAAPGAAADAAWGRHSTRIPPGRSCSPTRAARGAAGGPGELLPVGPALEQRLKGGPRGTEPCRGSAWGAAACGKPTTREPFRKDGVRGRDPRGGGAASDHGWQRRWVTQWPQRVLPCTAGREWKRWVRRRRFPFAFSSHCSRLLVTPCAELVLPMMVIGELQPSHVQKPEQLGLTL